MKITDIIVHRGNSPTNTTEPLEQVNYYVHAGFKKLEIDIYALSEDNFKFCHPLDRDIVEATHDIEDGFLEKIIERLPEVEWYVDLKCLDLDKIPLKLLKYLTDVFGNSGIITAAQREILDFVHDANQKSAQYFKDNIHFDLDYPPTFFIQNDTESKLFQKTSTIVYCLDPKTALNYLNEGYADAMVDGDKLIANQSLLN